MQQKNVTLPDEYLRFYNIKRLQKNWPTFSSCASEKVGRLILPFMGMMEISSNSTLTNSLVAINTTH